MAIWQTHLIGNVQIRTEPEHIVAGGDDFDGRFQDLEDLLEAPPDLFLADSAHGDDFLQQYRHYIITNITYKHFTITNIIQLQP